MKKYLLKLLLFLPLIIAYVLINVLVDPANLFHKSFETNIATMLTEGTPVSFAGDMNERELQRSVITMEKTVPNTIALGSSRVMPLNTEIVAERPGAFFNHGMSGAGVQDYIGIIGLYLERNELPKHVILGLDPWILNDNNGDTRYTALEDSIAVYHNKAQANTKDTAKLPFQIDSKYFEIISPAYFQSVFHKIGQEAHALTDITEGGIMPDGSRTHSAKVLAVTAEQSNAAAKKFFQGIGYQLNNYQMLSPANTAMLEELVVFLQDRGIEVSFFLPPYHPIVYQGFLDHPDYAMVAESETFFLALAKQYRIPVYGSFDPALFQGSGEDFSDGMHVKSNCFEKYYQLRP